MMSVPNKTSAENSPGQDLVTSPLVPLDGPDGNIPPIPPMPGEPAPAGPGVSTDLHFPTDAAVVTEIDGSVGIEPGVPGYDFTRCPLTKLAWYKRFGYQLVKVGATIQGVPLVLNEEDFEVDEHKNLTRGGDVIIVAPIAFVQKRLAHRNERITAAIDLVERPKRKRGPDGEMEPYPVGLEQGPGARDIYTADDWTDVPVIAESM
jgi:hypothetical protein